MLSLLLALSAFAAPGYVPIQGVLTDSTGAAIDGTVDVSFTLYDDANGTTSLWTDTLSVVVTDGRFATALGSNLPLDLNTFVNYDTAHLGIQVSGDSPMALVPLDTVPYAANSAHAEEASTLEGASLSDIRSEIPLTSDIEASARSVAYDTEAELLADLDIHYTYTAGTGISINGSNVVSADQTTISGWAQDVCYDSLSELRADLDSFYTYTGGTGITISNNVISGAYSAGTGIAINGATVSVNQSTVEGWADSLVDGRFEVVNHNDSRVTLTGTWVTNSGWSQNRLGLGAYSSACTAAGQDCNSDYIDLTLSANSYKSVVMSTLDWSSSGAYEVWVSYNGGTNFYRHKTVRTHTLDNPPAGHRTTTLTTLVSNLPQGGNIVVRVRSTRGRLHFEGFGLTQEILPDNVNNGSDWVAPTLTNGWIDYGNGYGPVGYRIDEMGMVHLRGLIRTGAMDVAAFTLPSGYQPSGRRLFPVQTSPDTIGRVDVYADGSVVPLTGSNGWISLDGISFYADGK
ncbi:MAG: hypothetical protein EP330_22000 [Deltaproteobacteria bacterium]|nr:MAG: hypothetical protein EP330_22000 [Deltaproteobacteria bacterium]